MICGTLVTKVSTLVTKVAPLVTKVNTSVTKVEDTISILVLNKEGYMPFSKDDMTISGSIITSSSL